MALPMRGMVYLLLVIFCNHGLNCEHMASNIHVNASPQGAGQGDFPIGGQRVLRIPKMRCWRALSRMHLSLRGGKVRYHGRQYLIAN